MHPTSKKTQRIITLQAEPYIDDIWVLKDGPIVFGEKLPYPFHISEDGRVQDQDFWKGDPYAIIGFQKDEETQKVDVWWSDVVADPELAVGLFPVFTERSKGRTGPYTYTVRVESVSVREK